MTKKWPMVLAALLFSSCAGGAEIPDNIPPAPPAWKGEARAPTLETAEEAPAAEQGFGTSAFDDAPTPTAATEASEPADTEAEAEGKAAEEKEETKAEAASGEDTEAPAEAPTDAE